MSQSHDLSENLELKGEKGEGKRERDDKRKEINSFDYASEPLILYVDLII